MNERVAEQHGAIAVVAALMLAMLIGFGALTLDLSYAFLVRNELQNAADATALAAAACLYPRTECGNLGTLAPDWLTATQKANDFISNNKANGLALSSAQLDYGYWNIKGTPAGLQLLPYTPGLNDSAAIKVKISKESGKNGGASPTFLAGIFGMSGLPVAASSVAIITSPSNAKPGAVFPIAISKCIYDNFWNTAVGLPKMASATNPPGFDLPQIIGQPYFFKLTSSYSAGPCESGQWSSLEIDSNDVPTINALISAGNAITIAIGDKVWVQTGSKTALYATVESCSAEGDRSCEYVILPVVQDISTHAYNPVVGFACVHILLAVGSSGKYMKAQMSADAAKCQIAGSNGGGPKYGAYVPARLAY
jgi:hypothetical protein